MPDWIVHLSIALLIAVIFKIKNWKLILAGAVLPDISRILLMISNFLGFDEIKSFLILNPLHTPFISFLMSMSIATIFNGFLKNLFLIYLGVFIHFVLDLLQFAGAFGHMLFYPFYFKEFSFNLFYAGRIIFPILGFIILLISLYYLKEKNTITLNKRFYFSIMPIILILILIFSTQDELLNANIHGVNFLSFPERYENKEIDLYNSKIISLNPIKLNEMGKIFILETNEDIKLNSIVTIKGVYKNNVISVKEIFFHNYNKHIFSFFGLLIFIYLILKK
jgi:hypothetical protein